MDKRKIFVLYPHFNDSYTDFTRNFREQNVMRVLERNEL